MSASSTTQQSLLLEVETLVAALMGDALPAEVTSIAERLEAAGHGDGIPATAVADVQNAVRLVRNGQPCAAISALLTARTNLGAPPR